jgi:branched-chain amino acid aminotransferase
MAVAAYQDGRWSPTDLRPVAPLELSPAAHVLHYASTCFEGFKAFRRADGSVHIFRMDRHIARMRQSARLLVLPEPDPTQLADMVRAVVARCREAVPEAPGALYLRPILFGTTANIGAAPPDTRR